MSSRRTLQFQNLNEVMPEVDRLLKGGHRTVGQWALGQICNHLAEVIRLSVEGFSGQAPWPVRKTVGQVMKRRFLSRGRLPSGLKLPEKYQPKPGLDDRAEAEMLRAAIQYLDRHTSPMAAHPLLGSMSRDEWLLFHAVHAGHHLGFAIPERLDHEVTSAST